MKKLILLLSLSCSLTACKKFLENVEPSYIQPSPPPPPTSIVGQWEWYRSWGEFSPLLTPQTTGKSWRIFFNDDSTFLQNGNFMWMQGINGTGTYSLTRIPNYSSRVQYVTMTSSGQSWRYVSVLNATYDTLELEFGTAALPRFNMFARK